MHEGFNSAVIGESGMADMARSVGRLEISNCSGQGVQAKWLAWAGMGCLSHAARRSTKAMGSS